ncbi:MAG: NifB/NifX family molybdenum-iron cluster-binding protein [Oribacterium sp.]|nr:NifB/NifX family molybdenum-iron cluster-binding protein [Oribacterium sp.]
MKIAVTYDRTDGSVFQHFGRTEYFKLYEVQDGKILSEDVIDNHGIGHEALAGVLESNQVEVVICGGLGNGMMQALNEQGISVYPGASGDADEAVEAFLHGELSTGKANCDHHEEHEQHSCCSQEDTDQAGCCGQEEEEGCSFNHEGCCGNCHGGEPQVLLEGKNAGKRVRVHYIGTLDDGTKFDSSFDAGAPLDYICGTGMMIEDFDEAVVNMLPGESVDVHLSPEKAYGMPNPDYIFQFKIAELPGSESLTIGQTVYLQNNYGQSFPVTVIEKDDENITLDGNHSLAGKALNSHIELLSAD